MPGRNVVAEGKDVTEVSEVVTAFSSIGQLYRQVWARLPLGAQFALDGAEAAIRGTPDRVRHLDLVAALLRQRRRPDRLFVGWFLHGDENDGATRVRGLLPHGHLRRIGVNSVILRKPRQPWVPLKLRREDVDRLARAGLHVVIFQGVTGPGAEALAASLRIAGTATVYAAGDLVRDPIAAAVDQVVVASDALRALAPAPDRAEVIEAAIDAPPGAVKDHGRPDPRDEIRVVWVGYPENLHLLAPVEAALRDPRLARYRLVTISRGPGVTFQWDRRTVYRHLLDCDIAVLPSAPGEWYAAKPNTRMTMLKALGLPMVASPVASYLATLEHGQGCYFARDVDDWVRYLLRLGDPAERRRVGMVGREQVLAVYSVEAVGERWRALLERVASGTGGHRAVPH